MDVKTCAGLKPKLANRNACGGVKLFSLTQEGVPLLSVLPPLQPDYESHGWRRTGALKRQIESLSISELLGGGRDRPTTCSG